MRPICTLALFATLPLTAADWITFGADPQRSGWLKNEDVITPQSVKGMKLFWKMKLSVQQKELHSLTVPLVSNTPAPGAFRELAVIASADNRVFVIDADAGKMFWERTLEVEGESRQKPTWLCPNALTATPVVDKSNRIVYVIAADGRLHTLGLITGKDQAPPQKFTPPYAKPYSLNLVGGVLYAAIGQGCNGSKNGVFAMDLNAPGRPVTEFRSTTTGGAGIWGRAGTAIDSKGRVWVETGDGPYDPAAGKWADSFLSLKPKSLEMAEHYTPANRAWITKKDLDMGCITPVVFPFKRWELVAGGGKEGVLYLLDAERPGGADHRTPIYRSPLLTNEEVDFAGRGFWGSISTWESADGTRWLLLPAWGPPASTAPKFPLSYGEAKNGSVMAFKIVEKDGKPFPEAAWISRDMNVPESIAIAGGVVFALSSGEHVRQVDDEGRLLPSSERIKQQQRAVLYALDGATGKELWNSGNSIESFTHFSGVSIANGRVYLTDFAGNAYAFGLEEK